MDTWRQPQADPDLHGQPYKPHLRQQLSQAYDAYALIILELEKNVQQALGHDTPDWCLHNACPACDYQLEGEPDLGHLKLVLLDSNNLSKWFGHAGHQDLCQFKSNYILSTSFVDQYEKAQGHHGKQNSVKSQPMDEPNNLSKCNCTEKWKTSNCQGTSSLLGQET
ncbi:hypothetical protein DACRYDRAFT_106459 [Dacryopinax primogenitus]|uniref:CxC1-like cysteine cluster associated with KDZ transposases domain-containing protein n=1 Tax=Dacryopinax primogenitus (strain DJM 731) TaxID=1858805 RepID=M5GB86_DACPD|nr:uncharacterized protein DACRYDRAFT_106459 [Dacryopinax primogenitus]EJU03297.1 hypothetical protein DACRYDRAFT_106459 [Dacryopinax primogenitus]